jgi:hypothetical protein
MRAAPKSPTATITGRCRPFTPRSDIKARMPPSPSLLMRIANPTYFTEVMRISVQMISDSEPSTATESGRSPVRLSTVLNV